MNYMGKEVDDTEKVIAKVFIKFVASTGLRVRTLKLAVEQFFHNIKRENKDYIAIGKEVQSKSYDELFRSFMVEDSEIPEPDPIVKLIGKPLKKQAKLSDFATLLNSIEDHEVGTMLLEFVKHFGVMIPTIRTGNKCLLTEKSVILTKEQYLKFLEVITAEIELLKWFIEGKKNIAQIFFKQLKSGV